MLGTGTYQEALMAGADITRPPVHRITLAQMILLALFSLSLLAIDRVAAYSMFSGGMIAILSQAYFAALVFRWRGARSARAIARSSYVGETGKFLLSAGGFALVFALVRPLYGPAVFGGYLAMLGIQIVGSWCLLRHNRRI